MTRSYLTAFLRDWVLCAALPIWLIATFVVMFARVDGISMNPTYQHGDVLLLYKTPRWLHAWGIGGDWPKRGEVIVFKAPPGHQESYETGVLGLRYRPYLIKRVVGVEGDRLEIREGLLVRNGERLAESYTTGEAGQDAPPVTVPRNSVYVLGDNRRLGDSIDSRYFGPVHLRDVAGVIGPVLFHARAREAADEVSAD
ncbi:signal peptidase I [Deinococcus peraridilitoris]|uniref:Signal peptidase I n=1 Tax=Deinococcus peraridilitoris (strain DSM 19664 / LMG 22246 / CIP 109416 / KR-200) TaxID=937777 RepID=L0A6I3_DEIPD|nr:signal peptidase I [Deinococcus peraridilitoris]AFZ68605.1 signal peptidase I [Deinococcus peraridilitoris DSM 19664]